MRSRARRSASPRRSTGASQSNASWLGLSTITSWAPAGSCSSSSITLPKGSRPYANRDGEAPKSGRPSLVPNGQLQDFRAVVLDLDWAPGKPVALSVEAAEALGVGEGASVRLVAV